MGRPNVNWSVGVATDKQLIYTSKALKAGIPFALQVVEPTMKYIIKYDFDLGGDIVTIPEDCILEFDGGCLKNGTVVGDGTQINASKVPIFTNITIGGTWNVSEITSAWFSDAISNNVSRQLINLTNENIYNKVVFENGTFNVSVSQNKEAVFSVKSNTEIIVFGNIVLAQNSFKYYYIFDVNNVYNVNIKGCGKIIGDYSGDTSNPGHIGDLGHGYGIRVTNNSHNVKIEDVEISNCSGDSIYVGGLGNYDSEEHETTPVSKQINIIGVNLHHSARQGISVTNAEDINILNCNIHDILGSDPQHAIDLEPNSGNHVYNVFISNCNLLGYNGGFMVTGHDPDINTIKNVFITNCFVNGVGIQAVDYVTLINNTIESDTKRILLRIGSKANNVLITNNKIKDNLQSLSSEKDYYCIANQGDNTVLLNNEIISYIVPVFRSFSAAGVSFIVEGNKIIGTNIFDSRYNSYINSIKNNIIYGIFKTTFANKTKIEGNYFDTLGESALDIAAQNNTTEITLSRGGVISNNQFNGSVLVTGDIYACANFDNNRVVIESETGNVYGLRGINTNIINNSIYIADNSITRSMQFHGVVRITDNKITINTSLAYGFIVNTSIYNNIIFGRNTFTLGPNGSYEEYIYAPIDSKKQIHYIQEDTNNVGTTSDRPTNFLPTDIGMPYFDTTLDKPIYWTGDTTKGDNGWVDANGNNPSPSM